MRLRAEPGRDIDVPPGLQHPAMRVHFLALKTTTTTTTATADGGSCGRNMRTIEKFIARVEENAPCPTVSSLAGAR